MKKLLSFALALVLALGLCGSALAAPAAFTDVPAGQWYAKYVNRAAELKLVSGVGGGRFAPGSQVTWAEFAVMLVNLKWEGELDAARAQGYNSAWWEPYCYVASEHGLFDGTEMSDSLSWDVTAGSPANRTGMAVMVYNFMYITGGAEISGEELTAAQDGITDIGHLDENQTNAVAYCYAAGILSGVGGGRYDPDGLMTRGHAATVLCSVYDAVNGTTAPVTPDPPVSSGKPAGAIGGQYDLSKYTVPADANKDGWLTQAEVEARIEELKGQYPAGTLWNDASIWGTDRKSADGYINSGGLHRYSSKVMGNGTGCAGWAKLLSDRIFGNLPVREFTKASSIHPGDVIADMETPHWMVYLRLSGNNYIQVSESGSDSYSVLVWDNTVNKTTLAVIQKQVDSNIDKLYTRYPVE